MTSGCLIRLGPTSTYARAGSGRPHPNYTLGLHIPIGIAFCPASQRLGDVSRVRKRPREKVILGMVIGKVGLRKCDMALSNLKALVPTRRKSLVHCWGRSA